MPWTIEKQFRFEAAHYLPHHDGKCARLHGHSWVGRVYLFAEALNDDGPQQGMLMDYSRIKAVLEPFVDRYLDHWCLNKTLPLPNPTSEEVARWCFAELAPRLPGLYKVRIEETCTSAAEFIR